MKFLLTSLLLIVASSYLPGQALTVYVAPDGHDRNEGTRDHPLKTVTAAQQRVEEARRQRPSGHTGDTLAVVLREGVYRLPRGITIGPGGGGTKAAPVVYRSYPGERAVISGAVPIDAYQPLSEQHELYRQDPVIGRKIIEIDLRWAGLTRFEPVRLAGFGSSSAKSPFTLRELYFNGTSVPLSRWPNEGYSAFTEVVDRGGKISLGYQDPQISTWRGEPNVLLHGYWYHLWADAYEHVASIDPERQLLELIPPYNRYGFEVGNPFAAYNVIVEIDRPGEWAYDYRAEKIYFYPPTPPSEGSLALAVCEEPLVRLKSTRWVTFERITFEMGASAGVVVDNSRHITLTGCTVHGFARDGVVIKGGSHNQVISTEIYDLGRGAIQVAGGDRNTLTSSHFRIDNCHIYNLSRIDRTYTPGVWVDGVGTTITHCHIHHVPSSALRVNGNDHTVAYNEIDHVVTESNDQGAIDMWGDPTYRGNVFRYNYIHDIGTAGSHRLSSRGKRYDMRAAIRFDDAISGNLVYGNIFRNGSEGYFGALQIHGGKENVIQNNLFHQCHIGISFIPWDAERWAKYTQPSLVVLKKPGSLYASRYPELTQINENLNHNTVVQNIFLECSEATVDAPSVTVLEDNLETDQNPGFANPEDGDYSLKRISKALKDLGFEPIPFEKIGLRNR